MFAVAHLRDPRRDRAILAGSLVALSGLAWLTLWVWAASPYGRYLHHDGGFAPMPVEAALFSLGWVLMIVAMMLPSSVPLVVTFGAIVGRRPQPRLLVALLLAGYLAIWARVRARRLGARPGHPRGRRRVAVARPAPAGDHRHHAGGGGPLAVHALSGPVPRGMPQPARVRDEPLARRRHPTRVLPHGRRPRRVLRRLLLVADARDVRRRPRAASPRCSRSAR